MREFDLIARYFKPLARGEDGIDNLRDDAACLVVPQGHELVVTTDTLIAGVHFFEEAAPATIARKALRVNLSDLIATGARPDSYQLALSLPSIDETWLDAFCAGLEEDQKRYGVVLSGGDTTQTPGPLSITITAMGHVPAGQALSRSGAKAGNMLVVSGPIGDAVSGLKILRKEIEPPEGLSDLADYCYCPELVLPEMEEMRPLIHAAIDISDGLVQDAGHLARESGLGIQIDADKVPFSQSVQTLMDNDLIKLEALLTGGDDYRLLMAVAPEATDKVKRCFPASTVIGEFQSGEGCTVKKGGKVLSFSQNGWQHF